jgi:hypothetical protein
MSSEWVRAVAVGCAFPHQLAVNLITTAHIDRPARVVSPSIFEAEHFRLNQTLGIDADTNTARVFFFQDSVLVCVIERGRQHDKGTVSGVLLPPLRAAIATVPVSKAMLPAKICTINSGSRIVTVLTGFHRRRLALGTDMGAPNSLGACRDCATKRKAILCISAQKMKMQIRKSAEQSE